MKIDKYLYTFRYHHAESELCKLESKCIFNKEDENKILFSQKRIEPSSSAFIKNRLEIISFSNKYDELLFEIKKERIILDDFKVEYFVLEGDKTIYNERLEKLRQIGYSIDGEPNYYSPIKTFALCQYREVWYFGMLIKNDDSWKKHKQKPCSYSNSISIHIAKAIVNIASKSDRDQLLLDACCGVGTIMLEACFADIRIDGCDMNWKICNHARKNLAHFNYSATVYHSDIDEIKGFYNAAIIDLPYNLYSSASDRNIQHIIESTSKVSNRIVIVSISDISIFIANAGLKIVDSCKVKKIGKSKFTRKIWLCTKKT